MSQFINFPISGEGVLLYTNLAAFPAAAANGALALALDTDILYVYNTGSVSWVQMTSTGTPGTVTSVSVVSANGLAGTVATANTTPAITLSTSITGILLGNGTAISAATTTGSGSVVLATAPTMSNPIVGTQSQGDASTKAASTSYVDTAVTNAIAGVNPAMAVNAATTSASDTSSYTYSNGVSGIGATLTGVVNTALTVDGFTFTALGQRLLVKNDTQSPSGAFNGIYYVTQIQTAILPLILTRALDYNAPNDINNTGAIPVINGTVNGTTSWVQTALIVTVGTTPLVFVKFTRNPADYLLVANNLSDVNSTSTSFNNISGLTTLGDLIYGGASGTRSRLAGNTTTTNKFLTQTGDSVNSAAPAWAAILAADVPNLAASKINSGTLAVAQGGTNLASGTSGGILYYSASGTLASSGALTAHALVVGGGAGATPTVVASLGTTTTVLHGAAAGDPTWGAVSLTADVSGILPIANGGTGVSSLSYYSGYLTRNNGWTTTSSTYADLANGTSPTITDILNAGFGSSSVASGPKCGVTVTLPTTTIYRVTATVVCYASTAASISLRLVDGGATIIDQGTSVTCTANGNFCSVTLDGLYSGTAGATTFKVQGAVNSSATLTVDNGQASGTPAVTWVIVPVR